MNQINPDNLKWDPKTNQFQSVTVLGDKDELQQQLDDVYAKMEYSDINTPAADIDFEPMDIDIYSFDEVEANDKSNFVNDSEKNMKVIDLEMYNFDEVEENDKSNFISTSETNFQYINGDKI